MNCKIYETERLYLKVLDENSADLVLDYYMRNDEFLREWEPERSNDFYTLDYQKTQLERDIENYKAKNSIRLWLYKKDAENKIIGCISFSNIVYGAFLSCFLGYKLDKDEINKGYMTEALKKGIEIMFTEYSLHRIEANIMPKNKPSIALAKKLGFYNEGLAINYLKINGEWEDHIHMVMLNNTL